MIKIYKNQIIIKFFISCLFLSVSVSAFGKENDVIWQSGLNLYFKYAEQDDSSFGKNDHPVDLSASDISTALQSLTYKDKTFFSSEVIKPVFSTQQVKMLGINLSKGLKNAKPDQDIIFVMEKSYKKLAVLTERALVAGRVFYKNGKLNIIIGSYNVVRNEAFESAYDPSGKGNVPYILNHGYRDKAVSEGFNENIIQVDGVENNIANNQLRKDWFVIDVKAAANAVLANRNKRNNPGTIDNEAFKQETERLARERRQLRLEMAKMRKEMKEGTNQEQLTVEERLARLDELRKKKLITEAEYEQKRKEILDDI